MAAFIVISLNERLNWVVDGIKNCRPHNSDVITYISAGKILGKDENNQYRYEYTTYSKHDDGGGDSTLHSQRESDTPRNLFANQIAQFLKFSGNTGEQLNIFCLDNPVSETDLAISSWMIEEIKAVYESRKANNFQLVRVLFSYQIDNPMNVNRQIDTSHLKQLIATCAENTEGFLYRILYIDNQNIHGAAICLDHEGHNLMIPRMLGDMMMLLSNNDANQTADAINSPTNVFAVGYAECMYYHDDVFRYYTSANKKLLQEHIVKTENDDESLDFEHHPIGLCKRQQRLAAKYEEVSFKDDINNYPKSVDKRIDDLVVSLKDYIISYKNEQDAQITANAESDAEQESDSTILTEGCPEYIDRTTIYTEYKIDENDEDKLTKNIDRYRSLIEFIQRPDFKRYIKDQVSQTIPTESENKDEEAVNIEQKQGCNFIARLFRRKPNAPDKAVSQQATINSSPDWEDLNRIAQYFAEREDYCAMKSRIETIQNDIDRLDNDLKTFRLTTHCSSVGNLIDLARLREYYDKTHTRFIEENILKKWNEKQPKERNNEVLCDILQEQTKWELFSLYYVNWDNPFPFIKDTDVQSICTKLYKESSPFVNVYNLSPNAQNLTSFYFYTDNPKWRDEINGGKITLMNGGNAVCVHSEHICSKICMFQFLQMDDEIIGGMVDLH